MESGLAGPHVLLPSWILDHDGFAFVLAMVVGALIADLVVLLFLLAFDWAKNSLRRLPKEPLVS